MIDQKPTSPNTPSAGRQKRNHVRGEGGRQDDDDDDDDDDERMRRSDPGVQGLQASETSSGVDLGHGGVVGEALCGSGLEAGGLLRGGGDRGCGCRDKGGGRRRV